MDQRIVPITIDSRYHAGVSNTLDFSLKGSYVILNRPGDYNVAIEKLTIPISNVPIGLNVFHDIWIDSQDKDNHPPKINGGDLINVPLVMTYNTIYEFVEKLNKHFEDLLEEYNYVKFSVVNQNGELVIKYEERIQTYLKIYVGKELKNILDGLSVFDPLFIQNDTFYLLEGAKRIDYSYIQNFSPIELLCTLQKFKIYTDLPSSAHYSADMKDSWLKVDNLLTDIDYNSQSMLGNKTLKYIPSFLREYSLQESGPVHNFRIWITCYHSNGSEEYINLTQGMFSSINLVFIKKYNIINDAY